MRITRRHHQCFSSAEYSSQSIYRTFGTDHARSIEMRVLDFPPFTQATLSTRFPPHYLNVKGATGYWLLNNYETMTKDLFLTLLLYHLFTGWIVYTC